MPVISVVMAVHNGGKYLAEAVDSILNQTFSDFEFLIIDDGSTDATAALLAEYARQDTRMRVFTQSNQGLTVSLNRGFGLAQGKYIARMDADDISLPERFARQVALLEANPHIGVCGADVRFIGANAGNEWHFETDPLQIRCAMLFQSPVAHPAVMLRKSVFDAHGLRYNPDYRRAQDYDLWLRAADVTGISNIPEVLLLYRVGADQASQQHRAEQLETTVRIQAARLRQMGVDPTLEDLVVQQRLFTRSFPITHENIRQIDAWLQKLYRANQTTRLYPEPMFATVLAEQWFRACRSSARLGISVWWEYQKSPLSRMLPGPKSLKLLIRCLLRYNP